jgi:hypothetical protein
MCNDSSVHHQEHYAAVVDEHHETGRISPKDPLDNFDGVVYDF